MSAGDNELVLLLNRHFFSVLSGISFGNWLALLRDNRFAIEPRFWVRAGLLTISSVWNSLLARKEKELYQRELRSVAIEPPVFIIGHWRSGTTFLHNLLSADEQFAFPNLYQVLYPETFLTTEAYSSRAMARLLPSHRLQDNVPVSIDVPQEDEYALCVASLCSQYLSWVFPRRRDYYERYLTLRGVSAEELERWKEAFLVFARKLTWKYRRRLLLKSPTHTCRIKLLLELVPGARFVHIHRHPHQVFLSSRHSYEKAGAPYYLQRPDREAWDEQIITRYETLYSAFFEERPLIPEGDFHELSFDALRRDPIRELEQIYERLRLPGYERAKLRHASYLESQRGYRMNEHPELAPALRERLLARWARSFEEWKYQP